MIEAQNWRIGGSLKCEQLAEKILPILVRQARARQTMTYKQVAQELGLSHHRPVPQALGVIAHDLQRLQKKTKEKIPPLTALVVNQNTGMFGDGLLKAVPAHMKKYLGPLRAYQDRPLDQKQDLFEVLLLKKIWQYPGWDGLLKHFDLEPLAPAPDLERIAAHARARGRDGVAESPAHRQLKEYVAQNPAVVGLPAGARAKVEEVFPSQDRADVWFEHGDTVTVVEIKPTGAPDLEIQRGIFQCVKYRALLEAMSRAGSKFKKCNVILALGGQMTPTAAGLAHTLGVDNLCALQRHAKRPRQ